MEASTVFCTHCGSQLPSRTVNYCPFCGAVAGPPSTTTFGSFRSRWLLLVLIVGTVISAVAAAFWGDVGGYLFDLTLVGWVAWVVTRKRIALRSLVGRVPAGYNWWPILLMATAGLVYSVGASTIVSYPIARYFPEVYEELSSVITEESNLHFFILAVVLAPLVEELVFRGLLFSRLTAKWGMIRAMVVSSLAFGLLHFNPIGAFVFGVVACVLYVRTRTLIVPIVLHALNNFIVWILIVLELGEQGSYVPPESAGDLAYQGLIAMLIASPVVFVLLGRWWPSRGTQLPYDANQTPGIDREAKADFPAGSQ